MLGLKRPKFGINSPRTRVSIIKQCGLGYGCGFVIVTPTGNYFGFKKLIRDQSGKNLVCGLQKQALLTKCGCGLALAAPTGRCFLLLKANQRTNQTEIGMRIPSNWVTITNHMCMCQ